jgi:DNA-binding IclR family transcriptional regulator
VGADRTSVLGKAMAILRAFGPDEPELSLAELARRTEIPRPPSTG